MVLFLVIVIILAMLCITMRSFNGAYRIYGGEKEMVAIFKMQDFVDLFKESIALTNQPPTVFLKDITKSYNYIENTCIVKRLNGNGQRKLCLEQIQFLTKYKDQTDILLYTGSAPGNMSGYV